MGVPGLFRLIVNQYSDSYISYLLFNKEVDNFFIDFNAMVYEAYYALVEKYENKTKKTNLTETQIENKIINEVIEYIDNLINKIVKPKNIVYIAMDGPVPMAKVIQQRYRRYKTPIEEHYVNEIKQKYNIQDHKNKISFDKTNISPGTLFMTKLSRRLMNAIKTNKLKFNGKEIIISDTNIPGEGEHKFMELLKSKKQETNIVYSPDADIIILSLISDVENIYVLKSFKSVKQILDIEENETNSYIYLDIDFCKKEFIQLLTKEFIPEEMTNDISFSILKDWTFLTILSGNDFVIPLPFLKMNKNNQKIMPILTNSYQDIITLIKQPLIGDNNEINLEFFKKLVKNISEVELQQYRKLLKQIHAGSKNDKDKQNNKQNKYLKGPFLEKKRHQKSDHVCQSQEELTPYEKELNHFYHTPFYDNRHPLFNLYKNEFRKINYFNDDWKKKYYQYYFNKYDTLTVNKICKEYMKILSWNLQYYFNNSPPSWDYYYPYKMPPLFCDLYQYLETLTFTDYLFKFKEDTPIKPLPQLMLILPESSAKNMIPTVLYQELKNIHYYQDKEEKIPLDVMIGHKFIYSEPSLENPNKQIVENIFNQHKKNLTTTDLNRNKTSKLFKYYN